MRVSSLHITIEVDTKPIILGKVFVGYKHLFERLLSSLQGFFLERFAIFNYIFSIFLLFILLFLLFDKDIGKDRILDELTPTLFKRIFILGIRDFLIIQVYRFILGKLIRLLKEFLHDLIGFLYPFLQAGIGKGKEGDVLILKVIVQFGFTFLELIDIRLDKIALLWV